MFRQTIYIRPEDGKLNVCRNVGQLLIFNGAQFYIYRLGPIQEVFSLGRRKIPVSETSFLFEIKLDNAQEVCYYNGNTRCSETCARRRIAAQLTPLTACCQ
jgi:hypothetical protein